MQSPHVLGGRVGALRSWARTIDRSARTAPARAASLSRFERQVRDDPAFAEATEPQILAAADAARRAYFAELAMRSAASRRKRAGKR